MQERLKFLLNSPSTFDLKNEIKLNPIKIFSTPPRRGVSIESIPPIIWFNNPPMNCSEIQLTKLATLSATELKRFLITFPMDPNIELAIQGNASSIAWTGAIIAACAATPAWCAIRSLLVAAKTIA